MRKILLLFFLLITATGYCIDIPGGKAIYIPKDLQGINLQDSNAKWSYHRMTCTENFVIFWEKGFGKDLSNPPQLEGHSMKVNLSNLTEKLEHYYHFFRDTLKFTKPGSKCDKYRMMVMLNYSLEGTAYGGEYDQTIGALWIAPNRIQDEKLNCIAHELGHCFQSQITCDGEGVGWGGSGFYEMASQWMLWQVNPNWVTDEKYHWDAYRNLIYKAFLHPDNIYHSPYVLEYWGEKNGRSLIAELFRQGKIGEDPVITYKRIRGLNQKQFCDEMFDACCHFVNFDFERVWDKTRPYANRYQTKLVPGKLKDWQYIAASNCPENYGFNAIPLEIPQHKKTIIIDFYGDGHMKNYYVEHPENAGWRYGLVAVDNEGKSIYEPMKRSKRGKLSFKVADGMTVSYLWLVVMGAPTKHWINPTSPGKDAQWPYRIKIRITK